MSKTIEKARTNYYICVGIKDGELYMLDSIFEYPDGFKGATGTRFTPVTQEEIDQYNNPDHLRDNEYDYFWKESVQAGKTKLGLDEWLQLVIDEAQDYGLAYPGHDNSYVDKLTPDDYKHFPNAVTFNCIGGGRCFDKNMEFDIVLRPDLIKLINKAEE